MRRSIVGFHQDEDGDWVAELSCLHNQHVRHRPPFQERPWVLIEAGRSARLGTDVECPLCERAEMPEGRALDLLNAIHDQLALQDIRVEVIVEDRGNACGSGCTCA